MNLRLVINVSKRIIFHFPLKSSRAKFHPCSIFVTSLQVAYVMATFPYVIMSVLMIRAFTLDGYLEGIQYYVTPDWSRLAEGGVWYDAAVQVLFSLSTGYGGLIMLASYTHFHNNCAR